MHYQAVMLGLRFVDDDFGKTSWFQMCVDQNCQLTLRFHEYGRGLRFLIQLAHSFRVFFTRSNI